MTLNFLITGDDNYLQNGYGLAVSIFELHKNAKVILNVMSSDITDETIENYNKIAKEYGQSFVGIHVPATDKDVLAFQDNVIGRWNANSYLYLLAGRYLPEDATKVMYLDIDIVLAKDTTELFEQINPDKIFTFLMRDLDSGAAAPTFDELKARMGYYGNTGQILLNLVLLRKWFEKNEISTWLAILNECEPFTHGGEKDITFFADQGFVNYVFFEDSDFTSVSNAFSSSRNGAFSTDYYGYHLFIEKPEKMPYFELQKYQESFLNAYLKNRISADFLLQQSDNVLGLIKDLQQTSSGGSEVLTSGVSLNSVVPGIAWNKVEDRDNSFVKKMRMSRKFLTFRLVGLMQEESQYLIRILARINGNNTDVRLILMNNGKFLLPEVGVFSHVTGNLYELCKVIDGNSSVTGLGISSTDFKQWGEIEFIEFSVREI